MSGTSYSYTPLSGASSIRLLKFTQIKQDLSQPLTGSLVERDLENEPPYIALSYAWEGQKPQHPLYLKRHTQESICDTLLITRNCEDALRRFLAYWATLRRLRKYPFYIWVDAICIEQGKNDERSHQVSQMGAIYKSANLVWVWLGRETKFLDEKVFSRIPTRNRLKRGLDKIRLGKTSLATRVLDCYLDYNNVLLPGLTNFAYWTRIWTLQEFALAKSVLFFYGATRPTTADNFAELLTQSVGTALTEATLASHLFLRYRQTASFTPANWMMLLGLTRMKFCTEPRDKYYAIRALFPGWSELSVDYTLSIETIAHQATVILLTNWKDLCFLEHLQNHRLEAKCASWVLDWNPTESELHRLLHGIIEPAATSHSPSIFTISEDELELWISGIVVDDVDRRFEQLAAWSSDITFSLSWTRVQNGFTNYMASPSAVQDIIRLRIWLRRLSTQLDVRSMPAAIRLYGCLKECYWSVVSLEEWTSWSELISESLEVDNPSHSPLDMDTTQGSNIALAIRERIRQKSFLVDLHFEVLIVLKGLNLFATLDGRIGLSNVEPSGNDVVVLISGMNYPMIMRHQGGNRYQMIGRAMIEGMMQGELWPEDTTSLDELVIV